MTQQGGKYCEGKCNTGGPNIQNFEFKGFTDA